MSKNIYFIKNNIIFDAASFDDDATPEFISTFVQEKQADRYVDSIAYPNIGIGYTWEGNGFREPKPYASWVWNENQWEAPLALPTDGLYEWNEETQSWLLYRLYADINTEQ